MPTMSIRQKRYPINQSPLYRLRSHKKLAALFGMQSSELRAFLRSKIQYNEFDLPKKSGGARRVENPRRPLKLAQRRLARILSRVEPPDYLFCPVKGRSYVTNAARHNGARVIRCLDVRKYFPNTPSRRVYWFFRTVMRCESDVADSLTKLATYRGHLPTGSPLSPIMAFFAYYDVWSAVAALANSKELLLSVYIDDVTVSGHKVTASDIWEIKKVIHASGLRYHKEKHLVAGAAEVTGVVIVQGNLKAPNRQLKKLHDMRQRLKLSMNVDAQSAISNKIKGLVGQLDQIRNAAR